MPEVHYRTVVPLPRQQIWDFVKDIDNWAPMMTGYVSHEVQDERNSVWTLRGDVGILSRSVRLAVCVTEWAGPDRVTFTLKGLNEAVDGGGSFVLEDLSGGGGAEPAPTPAQLPAAVEQGWWRRFLGWLMRTLFRAQHGDVSVPDAPQAGGGEGGSTGLSFTWTMEAGGATAPLVNAMLEPALEPAAEHLAKSIAAHLLGSK